MAEKIGIPQQTYAGWEVGNRQPKLDKLAEVALQFAVSLDWLLGLSDRRPGGVNVTAGDGSAIASESPGAYVHTVAPPPRDSDPSQVARLLSIIESQQRVIENLSSNKK